MEEKQWRKELEKMLEEMERKFNKEDVDPLKEELEKKIEDLSTRLDQVARMKTYTMAAGSKRRLYTYDTITKLSLQYSCRQILTFKIYFDSIFYCIKHL